LDRLAHMVSPSERDGMLSLLAHQAIGILSQHLLPSTEEGRATLVCEHLEVEGAARGWLRSMDVPALAALMRRTDNPNNMSYQRALVAAVQEGRVSPEAGVAHAPNPHEFLRSLRGIP